MSELKEGKPFWYVDKFRITKYKIIYGPENMNNSQYFAAWVADDTVNGSVLRFNKDKVCFTKEEAIELLKRDTDKLIEQIENDL